MKRILKEPLLQFLFLGALLYILVSFVQSNRNKRAREIVIDKARVALMIANYKSQTGSLPTEQQVDAMIDNYIKEEIFYREAKKMGLDQDDEIIRRRLSQKYQFLQSDLEPMPVPTDKQLKEFYKDHPDLFQTEGSVNFTHIYFSTDNSNDSNAKSRAIELLHLLKNSNILRAPEKGDRFPLQYDYTDQTALDIRQNFGDKSMLDSLFHSSTNTWVGPVQSGYGWHLIYINSRENSSQIPFESKRDQIQTKYMDVMKMEQNKKAFEKISNEYQIKKTFLE